MTDQLEPLIIPDEPRTDIPEGTIYPPEYEGHFSSLMISRSEISDRVKSLAASIHADYGSERPVMVCVLKGANPHLLEALQELKHGYTIEFLRASSYEGTSSTGTVQISGGIKYEHLRGRHVILIEDIVDTGTTLASVMPILEQEAGPKSLQVCALLEKRLKEPPKTKAKYTGFSIPDHFIIGYGLDYNELYRDLRDIWVISQAGVEFDQSTLYPVD